MPREDLPELVIRISSQSVHRLTPAALHNLHAAHQEQVPPLCTLAAEVARVEHRLAGLVNTAYGLTPEAEVKLIEECTKQRYREM